MSAMKLTRFLQKLANETVTVELKNATTVTGTVVGVDVAMNMHMRTVKLSVKGENTKALEIYWIDPIERNDIIRFDSGGVYDD